MYTAACKHNIGMQQALARCPSRPMHNSPLPVGVASRPGGGEGNVRGVAAQANACILSFRIPVAVQDSSPPLVAVACTCPQPCAWPCAWPAATAITAETAAAATLMMRSARRHARKCVAQWRPPCPHGKRGQHNTVRVEMEGRGVVWISECPDSSAMERSPERPLLGFLVGAASENSAVDVG
eukprot:359590-Chlamydomonas_euryale.AAC.14